MPGRSPSPHGFTILGLLAVLLVLSLGAATTVRWYFSKAEITLENAAVLLARDLRAAQHRSIFLGEPGRFVFLPEGEGYALMDERGAVAHNPQTELPFLRVYGDDGVFLGVHVLAAVAGTDATLQIDEHGIPTEDLSVTLAFGDERRTVRLDAKSGLMSIEGSTRGWSEREL